MRAIHLGVDLSRSRSYFGSGKRRRRRPQSDGSRNAAPAEPSPAAAPQIAVLIMKLLYEFPRNGSHVHTTEGESQAPKRNNHRASRRALRRHRTQTSYVTSKSRLQHWYTKQNGCCVACSYTPGPSGHLEERFCDALRLRPCLEFTMQRS